MQEIDYKNKYIKYKTKYELLKNQLSRSIQNKYLKNQFGGFNLFEDRVNLYNSTPFEAYKYYMEHVNIPDIIVNFDFLDYTLEAQYEANAFKNDENNIEKINNIFNSVELDTSIISDDPSNKHEILIVSVGTTTIYAYNLCGTVIYTNLYGLNTLENNLNTFLTELRTLAEQNGIKVIIFINSIGDWFNNNINLKTTVVRDNIAINSNYVINASNFIRSIQTIFQNTDITLLVEARNSLTESQQNNLLYNKYNIAQAIDLHSKLPDIYSEDLFYVCDIGDEELIISEYNNRTKTLTQKYVEDFSKNK
jgi:hypothetical protein